MSGNSATTRRAYVNKTILRCLSKRAAHFMVVLLIFINEYSILCIVITRLKTILDVIIMLGFYLALLDTAEEKSRFEELYLLYRQDMYKTAYSILQDSFEAEDVVHEAFLIVIKK